MTHQANIKELEAWRPTVLSPHIAFVMADMLHLNTLQRLQPTASEQVRRLRERK